MLWFFVIILAYFFFSLSSLGDKLILTDKIKPKLYVFYVGVFGLMTIILTPFTQFNLPNIKDLIWIILEAIAFILGMYTMFLALEKFEASKAIPVIGAIQPIFILFLTLIFWQTTIGIANILAFMLLLLGSIIISLEKKPQITFGFLKITIFSAFIFSLDYTFLKIIFSNQSFLQGLIWTRIFIFLFVLTFLLNKDFRKQVFEKKKALDKQTGIIFLLTQIAGGSAFFLQSFAIFLAPVVYLPIVNALRGIQYIFLFLITLFFSHFYPKVLKEEISKKIIVQKVFSILIIFAGLVMLVLN